MSSESFEENLSELNYKLKQLSYRYQQIQQAQQQQKELSYELTKLEINPQMSAEIENIRAQLGELELILESGLLRDNQLRYLFWQAVKKGLIGDIFWQALRFGTMGMILGWLLKG